MKANITLELTKEDLSYELEKLISEIASEEIRNMVKEKVDLMVEQEIKRIIAPIVDSYLENAQVGREYVPYNDSTPTRRHVDDYIKKILMNYLDEPCYVYSRDSSELSKRYWKSSEGGERTTRAEHWIKDKVREYVDRELFQVIENKINETVKALIPSKEEIDEIIKREIKERLK